MGPPLTDPSFLPNFRRALEGKPQLETRTSQLDLINDRLKRVSLQVGINVAKPPSTLGFPAHGLNSFLQQGGSSWQRLRNASWLLLGTVLAPVELPGSLFMGCFLSERAEVLGTRTLWDLTVPFHWSQWCQLVDSLAHLKAIAFRSAD